MLFYLATLLSVTSSAGISTVSRCSELEANLSRMKGEDSHFKAVSSAQQMFALARSLLGPYTR